MYCLPLFRIYINKLRPPIKGVVMKIETSNEPVMTSNYVRYLSLQSYETGMQHDAHECLLQLVAKIYPNTNDDCMFKIDELELTPCNDCGNTANNHGVYIDWPLHLEDLSNIQTIQMCRWMSKVEYINKGSICHSYLMH